MYGEQLLRLHYAALKDVEETQGTLEGVQFDTEAYFSDARKGLRNAFKLHTVLSTARVQAAYIPISKTIVMRNLLPMAIRLAQVGAARASLRALQGRPGLEVFVNLMPGLKALNARRTVEFKFFLRTDGRGASVIWLRDKRPVHKELVPGSGPDTEVVRTGSAALQPPENLTGQLRSVRAVDPGRRDAATVAEVLHDGRASAGPAGRNQFGPSVNVSTRSFVSWCLRLQFERQATRALRRTKVAVAGLPQPISLATALRRRPSPKTPDLGVFLRYTHKTLEVLAVHMELVGSGAVRGRRFFSYMKRMRYAA